MTETYRVVSPQACVFVAAEENAECSSECLYGELVEVEHSAAISTAGQSRLQWCKVTLKRDDYQGYMRLESLEPCPSVLPNPNCWISARSSLVFSEPNIKSRVLMRLPFLAHLSVESRDSAEHSHRGFYRLSTGGYIWKEHTMPIAKPHPHPVLTLAKSIFLHTPYLWGGCSPDGIDCSGLVQALARAKNIGIPRDSADQALAMNKEPWAIQIDESMRQSADLIYWPGHTGILINPSTILHATAHQLSCVVEPLAAVIERAGPISNIYRIFDQ